VTDANGAAGSTTATPKDFGLSAERQSHSQNVTAAQAGAKTWRDVIAVHPAADLFPLMRETDRAGFQALVEDIKVNGLQTPIAVRTIRSPDGLWSYELLEGRNRLDAIEHAGFRPTNVRRRGRAERLRLGKECGLDPFLGLDGDPAIKFVITDDPYAYVISANIHRRHLTGGQKRELIAAVLKAGPERSNNSIGKLTKTDDKTVAGVRHELEGRSEIPNVETRTDAAGRQQPAKKKRRIGWRSTAAKKRADKIATAGPGDTDGPALPPANPIAEAWNAASGAQRREFVGYYAGEIADLLEKLANAVAVEQALADDKTPATPSENAVADPAAEVYGPHDPFALLPGGDRRTRAAS
jgi:hypothetical protein